MDVDEVERIQRNGLEDVYVIEVKNTVDGVATEIDLYYSKDGVLVKNWSTWTKIMITAITSP